MITPPGTDHAALPEQSVPITWEELSVQDVLPRRSEIYAGTQVPDVRAPRPLATQGWRAIQAQSRDIPSSSHGFLTREDMCQI